jgi:hypothetical protein
MRLRFALSSLLLVHRRHLGTPPASSPTSPYAFPRTLALWKTQNGNPLAVVNSMFFG